MLPAVGAGCTAYVLNVEGNGQMAMGAGLCGLVTLVAFFVCGLGAISLGFTKRWALAWSVLTLTTGWLLYATSY